MGEPVRERPVVGQEQHAGRVAVEASDRHDANVAADEVDDGRPPSGSRAVVIVPRGLLRSTCRSACFPTSRPSTFTTSLASTKVLSCPGAR